MNTIEIIDRATALKAATREAHEALDQGIMKFNPFASAAHYSAFVQMQYAFHRDVAALFPDARLNQLFPELHARSRLQQVTQDLADLGLPVPALNAAPAFSDAPLDLPTAIGWLYVEEGSNLGGAFLFKAAAKLGFDAGHGARHLAPHAEGRAPNWRVFVAQLNQIVLTEEEDARVTAGAVAAFRQVSGYMARFCVESQAN